MAIPAVEEVLNVSSYHFLESMGFDTDISNGVAKMRAATLLREIIRLHQRNKNLLKYVHTNSKHGYLVSIKASYTEELFSRSVIHSLD